MSLRSSRGRGSRGSHGLPFDRARQRRADEQIQAHALGSRGAGDVFVQSARHPQAQAATARTGWEVAIVTGHDSGSICPGVPGAPQRA